MTLYLIRAGCPSCDAVVDLVERTTVPVGLMQHVPIETRYCPTCGRYVGVDEWDLVEDARIERVPPAEEVGT